MKNNLYLNPTLFTRGPHTGQGAIPNLHYKAIRNTCPFVKVSDQNDQTRSISHICSSCPPRGHIFCNIFVLTDAGGALTFFKAFHQSHIVFFACFGFQSTFRPSGPHHFDFVARLIALTPTCRRTLYGI